VRDRTDRVMGGVAGVEALDPKQPQKALLAIGEQFLALAREEDALASSARSMAPPRRSPRPARLSIGKGPIG
jgi:hypothetical protein